MAPVKRRAADREKRLTKGGYVLVRVGGRWRREHRVVVARCLGRRLKRCEVVHHLNENRADNRPANLMVFGSASGHTRYHDGKPVRPVWDGRTEPVDKPHAAPDGPELQIRIIGTEPIEWRTLAWFQGNLKRLPPANLERLKHSIRRHGLIDGFRVWRDPDGRVWILDGHQRRRALAELEGEGMVLPDVMPGFWVDCADRADAARMVLLYSSRYGEMGADATLEFVKAMGVDIDAAEAEVQLPELDFTALARAVPHHRRRPPPRRRRRRVHEPPRDRIPPGGWPCSGRVIVGSRRRAGRAWAGRLLAWPGDARYDGGRE